MDVKRRTPDGGYRPTFICPLLVERLEGIVENWLMTTLDDIFMDSREKGPTLLISRTRWGPQTFDTRSLI